MLNLKERMIDMKTYYLKQNKGASNTKERLLRLINDKYIDELEIALENDDARRVHNIMDNFMLEIYKATGVWFDTFDYYYQYADNLNAYLNLMIRRLNEIFS